MSKINKLGRMLRDKKISCVELTKTYLSEAKRLNPNLNAYITITEETALEAAGAADKKLATSDDLPALFGIPFTLKDNIVTSGIKTTCASKMLSNHVPVYDAAIWEYLKKQGAVLIGKSNMDEMAMGKSGATSFFGASVNPHDSSRIPGGSSGGTAVAVASGMAAYGIGTDTGGSIRQPASYCGLVGLKPTYGSVSRYGVVAFASSLDTAGPITTCVHDAATVFDAISQYDKRDMKSVGCKPITELLTKDIKGMKIGVAPEFFEGLSSDVSQAVQNALKTLEKMGAVLVDLNFTLLKHATVAYRIISCAEAASNLGRFDGIQYGFRTDRYDDIEDLICKTRSEGFGTEVKKRILLGTYVLSSEYHDVYYKKALELKQAICYELKKLLSECDCLIAPTTPTTAPKVNYLNSADEEKLNNYNAVANLAGLPSISIPCGFDKERLPIGMQIIGDKFCENVILNAALAFETETDGAFLNASESEVL